MPNYDKRGIKRLYILLLVVMVLLPSSGFAGTYWVSPTGTATWTNCRSETPLDGTAACSLATANKNAIAGDVVYLMSGAYGTPIKPSNSGSAGKVITFAAYPGQTVTFSGSIFAIHLEGVSYIKVSGITATDVNMFYRIGWGSSYNEITGCTFDAPKTLYYSLGLIVNNRSDGSGNIPSKHNWIHNNTFSRYGGVANCNDSGTVRIGQAGDNSSNNTIENNIFFYGGHDLFDLGGKYNIIRNNIFHNEEAYFKDPGGCPKTSQSGYFGNRNIIVTGYGKGEFVTDYNLIEGNRVGHAGRPPDDDGAFGIENAGAHTIVRYNYIFGNGAAGYYTKVQGTESGQYAHVFNNTIYGNGYGDPSILNIFRGGVLIACQNTTFPAGNVIKNNIIYGNYSDNLKTVSPNCSEVVTYINNYTSDPSFLNVSMTDKTSLTLPDLRLSAGSPAIDRGAHLTQARGLGNHSTTLIVDDAMYFQDGTWGSDLARGKTTFPDWIAIGSVDNVVEIKSIDYSTNTIILKSPMSWSDRAKIWLYKKSDGERVLYGSAPDYGAHEYVPTSNKQSPTPPKSLHIQ